MARSLRSQARAWLAAAEGAGLELWACVFRGRWLLYADRSDVDHTKEPAAPSRDVARAIIDELIARRRIFTADVSDAPSARAVDREAAT